MAYVSYTDDNKPYVVIQWHIEDVEAVLENRGVTLTDDEIEDVLHSVANSHDANYGITWEHLECAVDNILDGRMSLKRLHEKEVVNAC